MPSYPKWLYHAVKPATVVADEAAHTALGAAWVESPADAAKAWADEMAKAKEESPAPAAPKPPKKK